MANERSFCFIIAIDDLATIGKPAYLSMPEFLVGCHYNEEEISRHLEKKLGYWPVQVNGNKFATDEIVEKTVRSCEGTDFSWLSSKFSRTLPQIPTLAVRITEHS
jgi:ABC-type phosphate transport system auxiliary subunit